MQDRLIVVRNWIILKKYQWILKPIFFKFEPETIHDRMSNFLYFLGKYNLTKKVIYFFFGYANPILEQTILGINFKNPVGLSAGFDKNGKLIDIMPSLGFGFIEIGSITAKPYEGNPKPWLYRLPKVKSIRVNYGLKNLGAEALLPQLQNKIWPLPVGINVAKTNSLETSNTEKGIEDYFFTYKTFQNIGNYFTLNISCPNTCEEKPIFAEPQNLDLLLAKIFSIPKLKPVFIKLSPDLSDEKLHEILEICRKYPIDGFVCGNLTKVNSLKHEGTGGFSGLLVQKLSDQLIRNVYNFYSGKITIIGVGGIFNAEDAYRKIKAGASLVQLITGMVFEGPQVVSDINLGLVKLLRTDGYKNISEAVGKE